MSLAVKTINILGVTGSIGRSTADVILSAPEKFQVEVVTAQDNAMELAEKAIMLGARKAVLGSERNFSVLKAALADTSIEIACGAPALEEAAAQKADLTMIAVVGMAGLRLLMNAIENSKLVAIANKEPLVSAGPLVMAAAQKHGTKILPVDSEHNAIFQVFDFDRPKGIDKIILTASGGPFLKWPVADIQKASPAQALAHPNWSMGRKISIDSATMMNKALEVIEAHYLFNMPPEKIEVLVHPQSVIHSMVEYADGSVLAQMGASDMRTPIAHVLAWPERMRTPGERLDLINLKSLTFEQPDYDRFPAVRMAYDVLRAGPRACVAFNAANEIAVEAFLNNRIAFLDIIRCIDHILNNMGPGVMLSLADIVDFDMQVRGHAEAWVSDITTAVSVL
jgi:1-deoxy-D-xylulose-5-phosphate reductoisomerase